MIIKCEICGKEVINDNCDTFANMLHHERRCKLVKTLKENIADIIMSDDSVDGLARKIVVWLEANHYLI
jgi:hypothetical protein